MPFFRSLLKSRAEVPIGTMKALMLSHCALRPNHTLALAPPSGEKHRQNVHIGAAWLQFTPTRKQASGRTAVFA